MRIAVLIIRILMGAMFLFASISFFFHLGDQPKPEGLVKTYMDGIMTVQMMPIVKVVELLCGIAFIAGRYVALATVMIFPIMINIVMFHSMLDPKDLAIPAVMMLLNLFLIYAYRKNYVGLLRPTRIE